MFELSGSPRAAGSNMTNLWQLLHCGGACFLGTDSTKPGLLPAWLLEQVTDLEILSEHLE
jgi:hypothetical protein